MDKKINIVEGNSEIRERIKLYLESKSYEIFEINYGNEAIFVWGEFSLEDTRTVMVHISSIRKIEEDPTNSKYSFTVRGYKCSEY